jgi:DNA-binding transcriptional LysR family regulator
LADRHPNVRITFAHVHVEEALPALLARDFDLVLHETYPGDPAVPAPGVVGEPLLDDNLMLATPVGWPAGHGR